MKESPDGANQNNRITASCSRAVILYACSGSQGHRILAENYCELMRSYGVDAVAIDLFEHEGRTRFSRWIVVYFWLLRAAPGLWRCLYGRWASLPGIDFIRRRVLPRRFTKTQAFLKSAKPDLVLSTHPIATAVANFLKERNKLLAPLWVAFSDWHTQSFWVFPNVARYLVPVESQRETLRDSGISAENITVVGMLLSKAYYEQKKTSAVRSDAHAVARSQMILIMGGGKGWALESIIEGIRDAQAQRIVISGSEERQRELEEYILKHKCDGEWEILGWVDPIPYLIASDLVIAKPGGLTTAETLYLNKPLILCGAMPGHEEENGRVLNKSGICWASHVEQLPSLISNFLGDHNADLHSERPIEQDLFTINSPLLIHKALSEVLTIGAL